MKLIKDAEFGLLFDTYSLSKLALPYDSFPPLVNEDECSAQYFSVSENRILFCCCFSISAFFDKAEVIS